MTEYKSNSYKSKKEEQMPAVSERQKVDKVVRGAVKTKKKNDVRKFADAFISEDMHSVGNYILMDVIIPAVKDIVEDIVTNSIRMMLRGETGVRKSNSSASSKISYRNFYDDKRDNNRYTSDSRTRTGYSYDDIILETRGEAEEVLARMDELIDNYGVVSVADLYDLVGITGNYTDNKYGWSNIRNAEPVRVRDGYILKLPKALPIN